MEKGTWASRPSVNIFLYSSPMSSALHLFSVFWCVSQVSLGFCDTKPLSYVMVSSALPSSVRFQFSKCTLRFFLTVFFLSLCTTSLSFLCWHFNGVSGGKRHILVVNLPCLIGSLEAQCHILFSWFQPKCFSQAK